MEIRLELARKNAKVKKVLLKADTIIGRSTECGLRIASTEVSRKHCQISINEADVTVRDLGSSNGTFINGYQLEPDTDYEIAPDSELALGGIKFFIRFSEPALPAEKIMKTDGLGSTVDLKPGRDEDTADLPRESLNQDADEDETPLPRTKEPVEEDEDSDNDHSTVEVKTSEIESVLNDPEFEISTHGDSALLEREPSPSENESAESAPDESRTEAVEGDFSLEDEVADSKREETEPNDASGAEPIPEADGEVQDVQQEDVAEAKEVSSNAGKEPKIARPVEKKTDEDNDVASFLDQVAEEETADGEEDGSLGDFFKQFE